MRTRLIKADKKVSFSNDVKQTVETIKMTRDWLDISGEDFAK